MRPCAVLLAALFAALLSSYGAIAAPQILALVETHGPVPLHCRGDVCSAQLSAVCLQHRRAVPKAGTPYSIVGDIAIVTDGNGDGSVRMPAAGRLSVVSQRGYSAVRIDLARAEAAALGGRVAVDVGANVSLVPKPMAGDANPLSAAEIERFTEARRGLAEALIDTGGKYAVAARITGRLINLVAADGRPGRQRTAALWREAVAADDASPDDPGVRRAADIFGACRNQTVGNYSSLGACLEVRHDFLMMHLNGRVWNGLGAGT